MKFLPTVEMDEKLMSNSLHIFKTKDSCTTGQDDMLIYKQYANGKKM